MTSTYQQYYDVDEAYKNKDIVTDLRLEMDVDLEEIPIQVSELELLEVLTVENTSITALPSWLPKLTKLTHLYLGSNDLTDISVLSFMPQLQHLDISGNRELTDISSIYSLSNLTELDIGFTGIADIPKEIGNLAKLVKLHMRIEKENGPLVMPSEINNLTELKTLYFDGSLLPDDLSGLSSLETLHLYGADYDKFPLQIMQLKSLVSLDLEDFMASIVISDEWLNLTKLYRLALRGCDEVSINIDFAAYTELVSVAVDYAVKVNGIDRIASAPKLSSVSLAGGNLYEIPAWIQNITGIEHLTLKDNQIASFPSWLKSMRNLKTIYMPHNPGFSKPLFFPSRIDVQL